MKISLIAAIDNKGGIGKKNELLCYLPNDLKYFKKVTMNKPIIMGYNTFSSIGKALPGRRNLVLTSKERGACDDVEFVENIEAILNLCVDEKEIMVIGGASIYQQFLERAKTLYITKINHTFDADVFFPKINEAHWSLSSSIKGEVDEKNSYEHTFEILERR